jgi:hypothetical protein
LSATFGAYSTAALATAIAAFIAAICDYYAKSAASLAASE